MFSIKEQRKSLTSSIMDNPSPSFWQKQFPATFKQIAFVFLIVVILPNIVLDFLDPYLGSYRSYINLDYFLPFVFLASCNKLIRAAGTVALILVFLIDLGIILLGFFPTLNLRDIFYLLGFIFSADKMSILLFLFSIFYVFLIAALCFKFSKQVKFPALLLVFGVFIGLHILIHLALPYDTTWVKNRLTESRMAFLVQNKNRNFLNITNADVLHPSPWQNATRPWFTALENNQPLNRKLLLAVVESWGSPNNAAIQTEVLKRMNEKRALFEYMEQGSTLFLGLTVQAELRELCRLDTESLDLREVKTGFQNCLPNILKTSGYNTYAFHGATSFMYGRDSWYKLAGFDHLTFAEDIHVNHRCIPFEGICDWDIQPLILKKFEQSNKIFVHWMTLTSHFYYALSDIHNERLRCTDYGLDEKSDACRNLRHITQFFDNFAEILDRPEMKGVEVIVVGDHVPPLFGDEDFVYKRENTRSRTADVPWIHFKIKE